MGLLSPNCNPIQIPSARAELNGTIDAAIQALAATAAVHRPLFFIIMASNKSQPSPTSSPNRISFHLVNPPFLNDSFVVSATSKPVSFQQHACCSSPRGESQHVQRPIGTRLLASI